MNESNECLGVRIRQFYGDLTLYKHSHIIGVRNYTDVSASRDANILKNPPLSAAQEKLKHTIPY